MLLPHHVFTILLTENPKVLIEISVSTLVFTKVLTVFLLNFRKYVFVVVIPNSRAGRECFGKEKRKNFSIVRA